MMNYNYLSKPLLYNTGFLPSNSTYIRMKQGLAPQDLASNCYQPKTTLYRVPLQHNQVCNTNNLYPINLPVINYGMKPIPNNSPSLWYIQSP